MALKGVGAIPIVVVILPDLDRIIVTSRCEELFEHSISTIIIGSVSSCHLCILREQGEGKNEKDREGEKRRSGRHESFVCGGEICKHTSSVGCQATILTSWVCSCRTLRHSKSLSSSTSQIQTLLSREQVASKAPLLDQAIDFVSFSCPSSVATHS